MTDEIENQEFSTPMMKQYHQIKKQHSDCLLFFRLGDFYELFNDDAKIGAQVLNITLTRRPRGKDGDIPMAGVPFHAADSYIAKLVKAGYKVAICEQMTEPDSKGIVEREVIRIVTPGTILDEKTLEKNEHNYIMSLSIEGKNIGIAMADLSTGDFQTTEITGENNLEAILSNELARFSPAECIISPELHNNPQIIRALSREKSMNIFPFSGWNEFIEDSQKIIEHHFHLKTLQTFGLDDKLEAQKASAALLSYLKHTQKDRINHIKTIRNYSPEEFVILDRSTINNLELFSTIRDQQQKGTLVEVLDHTATAMGGRMLRTWIRKPLTQKDDIENRLTAVEELLATRSVRENMQKTLLQIYDIPRLISRLTVGIGNAYDLVNLKLSLKSILLIKNYLLEIKSPLLQDIQKNITSEIDQLIELIENTIVDNPPIDLKNGGIIRTGVNEELDKLRAQVGGGKNWIAKLETQERERTGINSLKIKFNKVFGYYIEISKPNLPLVPKEYIRKQTMVNAERFITPELKEYEEKILSGEETINNLEYALFVETANKVLEHTPLLQNLSENIATLDCLINFSQIAEKNHYVKPDISEKGEIVIEEGRHPVVERLEINEFVPNDTILNLENHQLIVITGPNMAGKSVYMRQVALITLMAHIGSYVPAKSATISLVDRIFVRSGASDVIASGLSTFMVEMVETAHILNHATNKSLIIMDEIGRGTSTYDGISIAWAVAEYLVTNHAVTAKTLFATHYHELQMLEDHYPNRIKNYNVAVEEKNDGEPIFLHKVLPGRASHSYAVAVAKLAGVPIEVTQRANVMLKKLEEKRLENAVEKNNVTVVADNKNDELLNDLADVDLFNMTPIEAMNKLDSLKKKYSDINRS